MQKKNIYKHIFYVTQIQKISSARSHGCPRTWERRVGRRQEGNTSVWASRKSDGKNREELREAK